MDVSSENKELLLLLNNDKKTQRTFGTQRLRILQRRIKILQQATTLEDVRYAAGHFHELKGNRKGQWACDLDQPYRLIFIPHEQPIPTNPDGQYIWLEIKGVELTDILDYHEDKVKR